MATQPGPVLMLRGTRWSVNDPYNPSNNVLFFGQGVTIGERNIDPDTIDTHEARTALSVWDASIALAKYLEVAPDLGSWPSKRVIEVGAGCGLVGIVLGLQGASVTITDLGEVLPSIQMNVEANRTEERQLAVHVTELRWGEDIKHVVQEGKAFDLVVASDVIWLDHLVQPLVDTFYRLASYKTTSQATNEQSETESPSFYRCEIILAHETRSLAVEQKFFRLMEDKGFCIRQVPYEEMHPEYRAKDIGIYWLTLLQRS